MGLKYSSFSIRGIDVSQFNGTIDWTKVDGNFAAIRVGYGRVIDSKFTANWAGAKGEVNRIAYWYMDYYSNHNTSSTVNGTSDEDWGKAQANTCWNAIKDDFEGMVFLDIESASASVAPAISTVATRAQTIAKAFLQQMDTLSGKGTGIYCSMGMLNWFGSWFKDRPLWVAWYTDKQTISSVAQSASNAGWTGKCLIWQYASDGDADDDGAGDGISMGMQYEDLDLNAWMASESDYAALFSGSTSGDSTSDDSTSDDSSSDDSSSDDSSSNTATPLYRVTILINNLSVRTGPGQAYNWLRRADYPGEYAIYEEKNGYGRISSTASEWISLNSQYVKVVGSDSGSDDSTDDEETDDSTSGTVETALYRVKVLIYNLSVRSGPGKAYTWLRRANYPGQYDIYEEQNGFGRISTTASEWINLSSQYVKKIESGSSSDEEDDADADETALYTVKVLIYNLSVRKGPGILYLWLRRANYPGQYDIYEEKNGYGRISTTASEWISLSSKYVQKLESAKGLLPGDAEKLARLWAAHPELH